MTGGGEAGFVRLAELLLATAAMLEIELRERRVRAPTAPAVTTCCFFSTTRGRVRRQSSSVTEKPQCEMTIFLQSHLLQVVEVEPACESLPPPC